MMRPLYVALAAAMTLACTSAYALDPGPGERPSNGRDPSANFNKLGAGTITLPNTDSLRMGGAPLTSMLLNALPSGRRAVEQGQSDDQTVAGRLLSSFIGGTGGKTTLFPDVITGADVSATTVGGGGAGRLLRTLQARTADAIRATDYAACDGSADDKTGLYAALTEAGARARASGRYVSIDLSGRNCRTTATLYVNNPYVGFSGGQITALGPWTSGATSPVALFFDTNYGFLNDVTIDGGGVAPALQVDNMDFFTANSVFVKHYSNFGIKTTRKATEFICNNCNASQYLFTDNDRNTPSNITATGIEINTNDAYLTNVVASYNLVNIRVTGSANIFHACHVYSDADASNNRRVGLEISGAAQLNLFSGCYIDNTDLSISAFKNSFQNSLFYRSTSFGNGDKRIRLIASSANETAAGLVLTGNRFDGTVGNEIGYDVTGSGSWVPPEQMAAIVRDNIRSDGSLLPPAGATSLVSGTTIGAGSNGSLLNMLGSAGFNRLLQWFSGGVLRWSVGAVAGAEGGNNAGSDFAINRFSDAGAYLGTPLAVSRATGVVQLGGPIKLPAYTVGTLPACNAATQHSLAAVTDGLNPQYGYAAVGGGANRVPVFCDASNWFFH